MAEWIKSCAVRTKPHPQAGIRHPLGAGPGEQGAESFALWTSVALSVLFGIGLLIAVAAFPLRWMPGQVPSLMVVLFLAPLVAALMDLQAGERVGLAAQEFGQRRWAAQGFWLALLVAAPVLVRRLTQHAGVWLAPASMPTLLLSIALCALAVNVATALTSGWRQLHPQAWELRTGGDVSDALDVAERGRLDRGALIGALWRQWVLGAVILAGALAATVLAPAGGTSLVVPWGALALVAYCGLGAALIGHAARRRWRTQWQLEGLRVEHEVLARWSRAVALPAIGAVLGGGLVLALGTMQGAHALLVAGWEALVPLLNALLAFFAHIAGAPPPHIPSAFHQASRPPPPHPLAGPSPAAGAPGLWLWLMAHWPLLCVLAALVVLGLLWRKRAIPEQRGFWRALVLALLRELFLLAVLLRRRAGGIVAGTVGTAVAGVRRARRGGMTGSGHRDDLTPRQAVIALYLQVLATAARRGYARRRAQTPREYQDTVGASLPAVADDLRAITLLFMQVRYTRAPVGKEQVALVQRLWQSLRGRLRRAPRA